MKHSDDYLRNVKVFVQGEERPVAWIRNKITLYFIPRERILYI